ncbi:carboxylesterase/lipase family protein [Streptomyces sp. NPDC058420]|uniref:carboxylesterase/lipase family protein n=1 Tax=Streptomyces sp. NPDC058420 TaxID=3346489 RepID=UPI00365D900A
MTMHRVLTALGCALTAVLTTAWSGPLPPARPATKVVTHNGVMRGAAHDGYRTFEGIPYAAPPVGSLRWAPPHRALPWSGARDATRPASACPQPAGEVPGGSTDEGCLHLDVTTPDSADPAHPRPVIVWLHGGGLTTGAGSSYDAHRMATRGDVVVVTVDYRLGALGFLAHSGLPGSGTFGLADQQAALRWVRAEIGAFGGDAHNVTLAGESAGGYSVCAQLASPAAVGLFDRAIIESGPCTGSPDHPFAPYSVALSSACHGLGPRGKGRLRRRTRCRCLPATGESHPPSRSSGDRSTTRLRHPVAARRSCGGHRRGPFPSRPRPPRKQPRRGQWLGRGIIQAGNPVTPDTWPDVVAAFFPSPGQADAIIREYPVHDTDGGPVFGAVIGDANFACPTARADAPLAVHVPTWRDEFADEHAPPLTSGTPPFPLGAPHASELPYLFDLGGRPRALSPAQHRLAGTMIDYWTRFARSADPNGPASPQRPRHVTLSLAPDHIAPTRTEQLRHHCAFWNARR